MRLFETTDPAEFLVENHSMLMNYLQKLEPDYVDRQDIVQNFLYHCLKYDTLNRAAAAQNFNGYVFTCLKSECQRYWYCTEKVHHNMHATDPAEFDWSENLSSFNTLSDSTSCVEHRITIVDYLDFVHEESQRQGTKPGTEQKIYNSARAILDGHNLSYATNKEKNNSDAFVSAPTWASWAESYKKHLEIEELEVKGL
jgi:hypothetical protein